MIEEIARNKIIVPLISQLDVQIFHAIIQRVNAKVKILDVQEAFSNV